MPPVITFPPSPNWYNASTMALVYPDHGRAGYADAIIEQPQHHRLPPLLAYASRNNIILAESSTFNVLAVLTGHTQRLHALAIGYADANDSRSSSSDAPASATSLLSFQNAVVASVSGDKSVRIWNLASQKETHRHFAHKNDVLTVAVVRRGQVIVSCDKSGVIFAWNYCRNKEPRSRISNYVSPIQVIAALDAEDADSDEDLVAVGYQSGEISVFAVNNDAQIRPTHRLVGHSASIQTLTWARRQGSASYALGVDSAGNPRQFPRVVLASSSKDGSVLIWDVEHETVIHRIQPPIPKSHGASYSRSYQDRAWYSLVSVPETDTLLCGLPTGAITAWNLVTGKQLKQEKFRQGHNRMIFQILYDSQSRSIFTTSMDRQLILWDSASRRIVNQVSTLGGFVYSLDRCPSDPSLVAVGCGDDTLRAWTVPREERAGQLFDTRTFWRGVKGKPTVTRWHPTARRLVGFGTDRGTVAVMNLADGESAQAQAMRRHHKGAVTSLEWSRASYFRVLYANDSSSSKTDGAQCSPLQQQTPIPSSGVEVGEIQDEDSAPLLSTVSSHTPGKQAEQEGYILVSCGADGKVHLFTSPAHADLEGGGESNIGGIGSDVYPWEQLRDVSDERVSAWLEQLPGSSKYWCVAMQNDVGMLALGRTTGEIEVYVWLPLIERWKLAILIKAHRASLAVLKWYAMEQCTDSRTQQCKVYLASGSVDGAVHVHDLSAIRASTASLTSLEGPIAPVTTSYRVFRGHRGAVTSLEWILESPDSLPWLASTSVDRCLMIFSLDSMSETPKQYQVFANSSGIPRCTSWSAGDPSRIFVGFDDQTIQVWDVSNIEGFAPLVESIQAKPAMDIKGDVGPRPGPETSQGATVGKPTAVPANGGMLPPASEGLLSQQMGVHAGSKRPLTIMAAGPNDAPDLLSPQRATKQRKLQAHTRQKQHTKAATLFPLLQAALMSSTRKIQQQRCIDLAEQLYQGKKNDSSGDSGQKEADLCKVLFGNGNIRALIGAESVNHRLSPGGNGLDYTLEVWRGNIGGVFDRIKADTDVTSANLTFLALSPLRKYRGMPPRSTQMLEIFGEKLRDSGDYQTAALCFIGCDKTRQAVEMFERQGMYKEAIILAKARLSPEDDIIPVIYEKWAAQLESKGQLEQAALCYLSANKPTLAVQCTSKRDDLAGLETAKRVAELTGDPAAPECYFRLAIELSRQGEMYDEAIELFEQAKTVRLSGLFATVCRAERYLRSAMGAKAVGNENEGPQGRPWQGAPTPPRLVSELFGENDGSNYSNSTSRLLGFQAEYTTMRPDAIGQAAYYFAMAASVMARGGADPACDEYLSKCRAFLCEVYETGLVEAFISHFTYGF